jgi:hypothetical protein
MTTHNEHTLTRTLKSILGDETYTDFSRSILRGDESLTGWLKTHSRFGSRQALLRAIECERCRKALESQLKKNTTRSKRAAYERTREDRIRLVEQKQAARLDNARRAFEEGMQQVLFGLREGEALAKRYSTEWVPNEPWDWGADARWNGHIAQVDLPSMKLARELRELGQEFNLLPKDEPTPWDEELDALIAQIFDEDGE